MNSKEEQFSKIYDQYIGKIYRFVYLKVDSQETAEDITSKVFAKGWEAYKKDKEIANPGAFLYQIARNSVVDHYRGKDKINALSIDAMPEMTDQKIDPHNKAVLGGDIEAIKSALLGVKKDYQDIIILHYLEDMPVKDIAELLGKPAGTVRVMLHRGLKDLKDVVQES